MYSHVTALLSEITYLQTGIRSLDRTLGGLPRGRVTLLYGEPGTGKTTIGLQISANVAKQGSKTLFIDADNSFSTDRLASIAGEGHFSRLIFVSRPTSFQDLTSILENLGSYVSSGVILIVLDTVTYLYRLAMNGQRNVFSLNRELNLQLAYLTETAKTFGPVVLILSQVRSVPQGVDARPRIEPVANRVIKFWSHRVMRISFPASKGSRELYIEKAEASQLQGLRMTLRLEGHGFTE